MKPHCELDKEIHYTGHAKARLAEALRYKPEGQGFDFRWCHWNLALWHWGRLSL